MKRTKTHSTQTCDWCRREGIKRKADWQHMYEYACDEHKHLLTEDDGYMTEADRQTWGRLF